MTKRVWGFYAILCFCIGGNTISAQNIRQDDIVGTWLTEDQTGQIAIYKSNSKYFGKIQDGTSDEHFDVNNPDDARRNDPLIGLVILKDLQFDSGGEWKDGTVYDPKNGKTYKCMLELLDKNKLRITGYIGFTWIGRSEVWHRIGNIQ